MVVRDFVGGALVGFFVVTSVLGLPVGDSIGMLVEEPFLEGNMVGDSLVATMVGILLGGRIRGRSRNSER